MGRHLRRARRAVTVTQAARRAHLLRLFRQSGLRAPTRASARSFREELEQLGTVYLKLGQLLSSRPDLLPAIYIEELGKLVDRVPPIPFAQLEPVIARSLGRDVFASIDPEPVATASIAQIHRALLKDGRSVAVKIRRPGISEEVEIDLDLLRATADVAEKRSGGARLLQLSALAEEIESHLAGELDLTEEAANTGLIADLLADYDTLVVPQVIHPYVTEEVLVLEYLDGVKLTADHGLEAGRARELACDFFRAYVQQITVDGLYHADPHRGNVLLTPDGRLALLDFGLLGRLDEETRTTLSLLLLAHAQNRTADVGDLILELSLTTMGSDEAGFLHELHRKLPRYHWRSLSGIRTSEALSDLQRICVRYGVRVPTSFALVSKTLSQADAIARMLDPALDPIDVLREDVIGSLRREVVRQLRPDRFLPQAVAQIAPLIALPRRIGRIASRLESGTLKVGIVPTDLGPAHQVLRSVANRIGLALIVVGLLMSSAQMARVNHTLSVGGFVLSALLGLTMAWKIIRTPGEL